MKDLEKMIKIDSSNLSLLGRLVNVAVLLSLAGLFVFGSHYLVFTVFGAETIGPFFSAFVATFLVFIGIFCSLIILPPALVIFLNIFYYIIKNDLLDVNQLFDDVADFLIGIKNGYIFYLKYFFGDWREK